MKNKKKAVTQIHAKINLNHNKLNLLPGYQDMHILRYKMHYVQKLVLIFYLK